MTNTVEEDAKRKLGLAKPGRLELKSVETGQVRHSFLHGRTKTVQVEVRKKRSFAPGTAPAAEAPKAAPAGAAAPAATAEIPAAGPSGGAAKKPAVLKALTEEVKAGPTRALSVIRDYVEFKRRKKEEERRLAEKRAASARAFLADLETEDERRLAEKRAARTRALQTAFRADVEARRRGDEEAQRFQEEVRHQQEDESRRKAEEAARGKSEEEARNRDRIRGTLDLLRAGLTPFVERELHKRLGADWQHELDTDRERVGQRPLTKKSDGRVHWDTSALLTIMVSPWWHRVFKHPLTPLTATHRAHSAELLEVRNTSAHDHEFSTPDTLRAMDTAQRLLRAISAVDQADAIERLK